MYQDKKHKHLKHDCEEHFVSITINKHLVTQEKLEVCSILWDFQGSGIQCVRKVAVRL
jgi:hypothetical protein